MVELLDMVEQTQETFVDLVGLVGLAMDLHLRNALELALLLPSQLTPLQLVVVQIPVVELVAMVDLVAPALAPGRVVMAVVAVDIPVVAVDSIVGVAVDLVVPVDLFHLSDLTGLELMQLSAL